MPIRDPDFTSIQQMLIDLSLIDRHHYLAKTDRRENNVEHSMSVAVLSWYIYDKIKSSLDLSLIFKYALAHDFVERYAGDVNTFASKEERLQKVIKEKASLKQLSNEFYAFDTLIKTMDGYEEKTDDESLFVWTVDKMQALIMGDLDNWRPYQELGISHQSFVEKYAQLLSQSSPHCRDIFSELIEYSKSTYYDQPM